MVRNALWLYMKKKQLLCAQKSIGANKQSKN